MGKFERKIRKEMKRETEDFDVWFEKNQEKLSGFESNSYSETDSKSEVKTKTKKIWLIPAAFVFAAVCVVLCFLPMMLPKNEPVHFGDNAVYTETLSAEEQAEIIAKNPFLSSMIFLTGQNMYKTDDQSLVCAILTGEMETESDYYFITVRIAYNPYYDFLTKPLYERLSQEKQVNGYTVKYGQNGFDADELYWYYMLTEKDGQKIYWEVHCFEESIEQFIDLMLN